MGSFGGRCRVLLMFFVVLDELCLNRLVPSGVLCLITLVDCVVVRGPCLLRFEMSSMSPDI